MAKFVYTPINCIYRDKDSYLMEVELPGVKKEDIDVELTENSVCISGDKDSITYSGCWSLYHAADIKNAKAEFDNGLLKITLPFKEPIETVKLEVK